MVNKTAMMKKRFLVIFTMIVTGYGVFTLIQEMRKMNVMRWRNIADGWIENIQTLQVNLTKENFLELSKDCVQVNDSDLTFYFTPDFSNYVSNQYIFIIESYVTNLMLYKGQFSHSITIKRVPYCVKDRYHLDIQEEDVSDILVFRLFDLEQKRSVFWGGDQGYPYYNGKINRVTFFRNHLEEYHGYYRVEQEDK